MIPKPTRRARWIAGFVGVAVLICVYGAIAVGNEGPSLSIVLPLLLIAALTVLGAIAVIPLNEAIWKMLQRRLGQDDDSAP